MLPQENIRNLAHRINLAFHRTFSEDPKNSIVDNRTKLYKLIKILPSKYLLDKNPDTQVELLNYHFYNLKTRNEEKKRTPKIRSLNTLQEIQRESPKGKFRRNSRNFQSHKLKYENNRNFKRDNRNKNSMFKNRFKETSLNTQNSCQVCNVPGHAARQCNKYEVKKKKCRNLN